MCKMAIKTGIIFCTFLLGVFAIPTPQHEADTLIFFDSAGSDSSDRIVGGAIAPAGVHRWMVAFTTGYNARSLHCGGSLISARTVLTAAHCIEPVRDGNSVSPEVRVIAGSNRYNTGGQVRSIIQAAVHPLYDAVNIKYDVGTMFTDLYFVFSNLVVPISLSWDTIGGGVQTRTAGWGRTSANGASSQQLLEIEQSTLGPQECVTNVQTAASNLNIIAPAVDPNVEICTFHSVGRGTCRGDSGSPLVRIDTLQQIGVVSWGFPCALGGPDVYVRTSNFRAWIEFNTI